MSESGDTEPRTCRSVRHPPSNRAAWQSWGGLRPGRALYRRRRGRAGGGAGGASALARLGLRVPLRSGPAPVTLGRARPQPSWRGHPMAPSRLQLGLRAAYSGISSVAGFSIFFVWTVFYRQPGTASMGGLAGMAGRAGGAGRDSGGEGAVGGCARLLAVALSPGAGGCLSQPKPGGSAGPVRARALGHSRASGTRCL
jgi:hypothetical protein